MRFSKLIIEIAQIEKKYPASSDKISKSMPTEALLENLPLGSLRNRVIFSITVFVLR